LERLSLGEEKNEMFSDLILYSSHPDRLLQSLASAAEKLSDIRDVFVVIPQQKKVLFEKVMEKYPQVCFIEESAKNIKQILLRQILPRSSAGFILLATDQYIVEKKVDVKECTQLLQRTKARGFYFALGEDRVSCLRGKFAQEPPLHFLSLGETVRAWECEDCACGDWASPDGFVMALYEKDFLKKNLEALNFQSLEELERSWSLLEQERKIGLCFKKSRIGVVQELPCLPRIILKKEKKS
jgi:hypothetical protein